MVADHIYKHLLDNPCVDCGEADPIVLEFDHRDGVEKSFNIGESNHKSISLSRVIAEIAKCDVRCSNCHRRRTYIQFGRTNKGPAPSPKSP